ncbi:MAG: chalcone isomerase family protein [Burkholderiaceae bacterium]|jgi:hypothetical protein
MNIANRFSRCRWLGILALLVLAQTVPARTVEGYRFDETARVGNSSLQLNGVGVRAVSIFKGYVAALYVVERSGSADVLVKEPGPKRLAMRMLLGADAHTFVKALTGGLERNSTSEERSHLQAEIDLFNSNLLEANAVKPGDLVYVEFVPGSGTHLLLNGRSLGTVVRGEAFYAAFLKIFIGQNVQDLALKQGLLGSRART